MSHLIMLQIGKYESVFNDKSMKQLNKVTPCWGGKCYTIIQDLLLTHERNSYLIAHGRDMRNLYLIAHRKEIGIEVWQYSMPDCLRESDK